MTAKKKADQTQITVHNDHRNALKAAGHIFPPRSSSRVPADDDGLAAIVATRGLSLEPTSSGDSPASLAEKVEAVESGSGDATVTAETTTTEATPAD
jgi:hypothetical protein